jgi:hypothetical protein
MGVTNSDENTPKKGGAELLVLAQLEGQPRHGYETDVEIERRSQGAVSFQIASLHPVLYFTGSNGRALSPLSGGRVLVRAGDGTTS